MDQGKLNDILERHKAQPVGNGYIDIIVSRDNYKAFVSELVHNDYVVNGITWWEWCTAGPQSNYGLGGPVSKYYPGWFSELSINADDLTLANNLPVDERIEEIIKRIETKVISFPDETLSFKLSKWLTPALCLDVPGEWRNNF